MQEVGGCRWGRVRLDRLRERERNLRGGESERSGEPGTIHSFIERAHAVRVGLATKHYHRQQCTCLLQMEQRSQDAILN